MMPGLVHSSLSFSSTTAASTASTSSTSAKAAAADRHSGAFPSLYRPFNDRSSRRINAFDVEAATVAASSSTSTTTSNHAFRVADHQAPLQYNSQGAVMRVMRQSCPAGIHNPAPADAPTFYGCSDYDTAPRAGSQYDLHIHEPSSVCLAAMVDEFIEDEDSRCTCDCIEGGCISACRTLHHPETLSSTEDANAIRHMQSLARCREEQEIKLLRDVEKVVKRIVKQQGKWFGHDHLQRLNDERKAHVTSALQRMGYDAAVCKARWEHAVGTPGGCYEYIDVIFPSTCVQAVELRLLVDIHFRAQFEIARPTGQFSAVVGLVPPIFIGREEKLQEMVLLMAEATKRSLCAQGLHVPPWRKLSYMKAKWFSPYKRSKPLDGVNDHGDQQGPEQLGDVNRCTVVKAREGINVRGGPRNMPSISTEWQLPPLDEMNILGRRSAKKMAGLSHSLFLQAAAPANGYTFIVA